MCSIAIPSEHILGHSPPVYGPLLYSSLMVTTPPISSRSVPPRIRPCLSTGSISLDGLLKNSDDAAKRNKKKVVFADDRGRPLTQVRVMSEPSNVPPLWTSSYIAKLARGELFQNYDNSADAENNRLNRSSSLPLDIELDTKDINKWEVCFPQPASDYLAFRGKIEKDSVSLENVIIKEQENCLIGTVKVKNISYDKQVGIRMTLNNWKTYVDLPCSYVEQPGMAKQTAVRNLYDTFKFDIPLPSVDSATARLEFCVFYKTGGADYWDNNDTQNYTIVKKRDVTTGETDNEEDGSNDNGSSGENKECGSNTSGNDDTEDGSIESLFDTAASSSNIDKKIEEQEEGNAAEELPNGPVVDEATKIQLHTWSEFASWQHLENDSPYW